MVKYHPFHLVTPSPWPIVISVYAFVTAIGATMYLHTYNFGLLVLIFGLVHVVLVMALWWNDVINETILEGKHTERVTRGFRIGFILFIVSEIMFFFGFFLAYFYISLSPNIHIGCIWPPYGITPFNPLGIPLVNTIVLLLSSCTITYAHHALLKGDFQTTVKGFLETLVYAVLFTGLQFTEYFTAPFDITDSIFGSCFYMITGLHGFHVIIGTIFLSVCFIRLLSGHLTRKKHTGFELGAWYWHFVDTIWIFVFIVLYCMPFMSSIY